MKAKIFISSVVVLAVAGGIVFAQREAHKEASKLETQTPPPSAAAVSPSPTRSTTPGQSSDSGSQGGSGNNQASSVTNITLTANDSGASQTTINLSKGLHVNLTFKVDTQGVYYGGLYFKSSDPSVGSAGPIKPGGQATVSFVANNSFSFQPYWYAENVKKGYSIAVNVH